MELPAYTQSENSYFDGTGDANRNYTMMYTTEENTYSAKWVAYPLAASHMGSGRDESWKQNTNFTAAQQINVWSGSYGVYFATGNPYARGHQIPNADRNGNENMQKQTFYATNSTPQIQNGFNGGIWSSIETAIRNQVPSNSNMNSEEGDEPLYITTGPVYRTVGGSETITYIQPQHDTKQVAVPNYYYKVVLKVKRNAQGTVTSAMAIGFWLPHTVYESGTSYTTFATSIDEIEAKTGFNFFANLPTDIEASAEANTSWTTFTSF